ncbi:hypothetical protein VTN00DRAFT_491 [Thermoascus crustaceus]|uniref:uncharacterized protein n=1 Tax=Thermoascus crustaceus TaxID=5088 RepID=UPI00374243EB
MSTTSWKDCFDNKIPPWTFKYAQEALALHSRVGFFVDDFASAALSRAPTGRGEGEVWPLSLSERWDAKGSQLGFEDQLYLHMERYAAWENEQLACVADYLFRRFDEVAEHDIGWAQSRVHYADQEAWKPPESFRLQAVSHGLPFLHRVITPGSYEELYELLDWNLWETRHSIHEILTIWNSWNSWDRVDDSTTLENHDDSVVTYEAGNPFYYDPDTGPEDAWWRAHLTLSRKDFANSIHTRDLRPWGYVLWDRGRLDSWGFFDAPWTPPELPDMGEFRRRERLTEVSIHRRRRLFEMGVRGRLIEDDVSISSNNNKLTDKGYQGMDFYHAASTDIGSYWRVPKPWTSSKAHPVKQKQRGTLDGLQQGYNESFGN